MASFFVNTTQKILHESAGFLLFTSYLFALTLNGRIFWEVIGKREEVRRKVAFRGGEKHFCIEKHSKLCYNKPRKAVEI